MNHGRENSRSADFKTSKPTKVSKWSFKTEIINKSSRSYADYNLNNEPNYTGVHKAN